MTMGHHKATRIQSVVQAIGSSGGWALVAWGIFGVRTIGGLVDHAGVVSWRDRLNGGLQETGTRPSTSDRKRQKGPFAQAPLTVSLVQQTRFPKPLSGGPCV